jgi:hypothetical protein
VAAEAGPLQGAERCLACGLLAAGATRQGGIRLALPATVPARQHRKPRPGHAGNCRGRSRLSGHLDALHSALRQGALTLHPRLSRRKHGQVVGTDRTESKSYGEEHLQTIGYTGAMCELRCGMAARGRAMPAPRSSGRADTCAPTGHPECAARWPRARSRPAADAAGPLTGCPPRR